MKLLNYLNPKRLFARTRYTLYGEIHNDRMVLGCLKSIKDKCLLQKIEHIPLNNVEISNGNIVNHSAITQHIIAFLQEHKLLNPSIIACIPALALQQDTQQSWATLQAALCIAHSPVRLEKIITQSPLPTDLESSSDYSFEKNIIINQQDLLAFAKRYNPHSPQRWATYSLAVAILLGIALNKIQRISSGTKDRSLQEQMLLTKQKSKLDEKVKELHQLNKESTNLAAKLTIIKNLKDQKTNHSNLLITIASSMPSNSWLTHITINPIQKPNSPKQQSPTTGESPNIKSLALEGFTYKTEEVSRLIKNLQKSPSMKNLSLAKLSKEQQSPQQRGEQYYFKIIGKVIT